MTEKQFIEKCNNKFGNKYSFEKLDFIDTNTPVTLVCPIHGEFTKTPKNILRTMGCPKCSGKVKLTTEEFIEKAKAIHGDKYDYSKAQYVNKKTKVCIICPEHGEFWQTPDDHCNKPAGCPKCKFDKLKNNQTYTLEYLLDKAHEKFGNTYVYDTSNFKGYTSIIKITCPKHGDFESSLDNHLNTITGCPKCSRELANQKESDTLEDFIRKANAVHNNKYSYYKSIYTKSIDKIIITCPKHGDFEQTPANHISGQGCPKCILKSQTRIYEKLRSDFPELEIWFEVNKTKLNWLGSYRLDIVIPKLQIVIEYNGQQHYEPIEFFGGEEAFQKRINDDINKYNLCKDNNYIIYYIKYNQEEIDYTNISNVIRDKLQNIAQQIMENTIDNTGELLK